MLRDPETPFTLYDHVPLLASENVKVPVPTGSGGSWLNAQPFKLLGLTSITTAVLVRVGVLVLVGVFVKVFVGVRVRVGVLVGV